MISRYQQQKNIYFHIIWLMQQQIQYLFRTNFALSFLLPLTEQTQVDTAFSNLQNKGKWGNLTIKGWKFGTKSTFVIVETVYSIINSFWTYFRHIQYPSLFLCSFLMISSWKPFRKVNNTHSGVRKIYTFLRPRWPRC